MNSTVLTALSLLLTLVIGGHTVGMGWFPPEMTALASFSEKPIDRSLVTKPMSMALSSSAATDLVKRQAGGWENADVDQIVADFAEDCHFIVPGQQLQGRSQVYQAATEFFAAANQVNITIHRIIVQDRAIAVEWQWHEINLQTGQESYADDAIVIELNEQQRIVYWREYIDQR